MGMPNLPEEFRGFDRWTWDASALPVLTRTTPLTEEEWIEIINARVEKLKRHLDSMTLGKISDVKCLRSEISSWHELSYDQPEVESETFTLDSQGIFSFSYRSRVTEKGTGFRKGYAGGTDSPDGYSYMWGLTRKAATWVLIRVEWQGEAGYKERGHERAKKVVIREATLPEIVENAKVTYKEIWSHLGEVVIQWMAHRHNLYMQVFQLATAIVAEKKSMEELEENLLPKQMLWYCNACRTRGIFKRNRGEGVPDNVFNNRGIQWLHHHSSPECSNETPIVFASFSDLMPEEKELVETYTESKLDRPNRMGF